MLALPRDAAKVKAEASEMRAMIEAEKPRARSLGHLSWSPGGLIDLEFIAQCGGASWVRSSPARVRAGDSGASSLSRL